jgi:hypothetical protein
VNYSIAPMSVPARSKSPVVVPGGQSNLGVALSAFFREFMSWGLIFTSPL